MSDEVLSQDEVETLLSAADKAEGTDTPTASPAAKADETATSKTPAPSRPAPRHPRSREKIVPYDFKRPERVGKEQMRALQSLHEGFGRNFGAALSAMLRSIAEVKLTSVNQLTYSEFIFSLENPTCFNLLKATPLDGHLILDINPSILYPIIDRLLGGGNESSGVARRPLTEIELRLVSRITNLFLGELMRAWQNILPLELEVERVESNPQLVQIVPPNEVVVLVSFELTLGDVRGMMNLCIPFNSIERISNQLTSNTWVSYARVEPSSETMTLVGDKLDGAEVEIAVTLAEARINTADLLGLRVGDIITTDKDIRTTLEVEVEGIPKFSATAGAYKGHKAIEIQAALTDEK